MPLRPENDLRRTCKLRRPGRPTSVSVRKRALGWSRATPITIEAYELFLLAWPEGSHVPAAKEQLRKLRLRDGDEAERAFAAVRHADSASAVAEFLASYPESALAAEARACTQRWSRARRPIAERWPATIRQCPRLSGYVSEGQSGRPGAHAAAESCNGAGVAAVSSCPAGRGALVIGAVGIWLVAAPSSVHGHRPTACRCRPSANGRSSQGQLQGMRRLSRDDRGAGGVVRHGLAGT
jgi:hypothetical protein